LGKLGRLNDANSAVSIAGIEGSSPIFNIGGAWSRKPFPPARRAIFEPPTDTIIPGKGVAPSSTPAAADTSRKTAGMAELSCSQIPRDRIPTSVSALGNNMVQLFKKRRLFATGARVKVAR